MRDWFVFVSFFEFGIAWMSIPAFLSHFAFITEIFTPRATGDLL